MKFLRRASGRTFQSLHVRNFRLYFIGQGISISGTWMQSLAQGYLVVAVLHGSAVDLGVTVALPFLPMLLLGPLGGVLVDRSDKRNVLFATQTVAGLLALCLGILVSTGGVTLGAIWTMAAILGLVNLLDNPARQSFVQEMVGRELLPNAVALNSALINIGRVLGPAISAVLLATVSVAACFYVNAASYAAVIVALALMRTSEITRIRTVERATGQVRAGFRYVWGVPEIRETLLAVAVVGMFAFNFTVTLPLLVLKTLHGSPAAYAFVTCSFGFGAVLGGLVVAHRARPTRSLLVALSGVFALSMSTVAVAPTVWAAALLAVPMGAASIAFLSSANALLQLRSREEMRGRVMSLYAMAFLGTTPIGAIVISLITSASNVRVAIGVGAFSILAAGTYLWLTSRERAPATVSPAAGAAA